MVDLLGGELDPRRAHIRPLAYDGHDCPSSCRGIYSYRNARIRMSDCEKLEEAMKKEILQENRARWELFEQIGSLADKFIWAGIGAGVALVLVYLLR